MHVHDTGLLPNSVPSYARCRVFDFAGLENGVGHVIEHRHGHNDEIAVLAVILANELSSFQYDRGMGGDGRNVIP